MATLGGQSQTIKVCVMPVLVTLEDPAVNCACFIPLRQWWRLCVAGKSAFIGVV